MMPNTRRKIRTSNMRAIMPMTSAEPRNFSLLKAHRIQQSDLTPQTISDATECASISTLSGSSEGLREPHWLYSPSFREGSFSETRRRRREGRDLLVRLLEAPPIGEYCMYQGAVG